MTANKRNIDDVGKHIFKGFESKFVSKTMSVNEKNIDNVKKHVF